MGRLDRIAAIGFVFMISLQLAHAQNIFVYDQQTGIPVDNASIFNNSKTISGLTNEMGLGSVKGFHATDTINIQHAGYDEVQLTMELIIKMKYKVALHGKLINLNEVVVSANRWEENADEIPNKIEVIRQKDIIFENPATSADMLASGNEVYVQKSQAGGGSPMIRGFAANKILFMLDGVRMNNAIYRSGNLQNVLQADVNSVKSAEVIFGPGTNIYGSDALGGVVDIHLMEPEFNPSEKWHSKGHAMTRIASADFERTVHADLNVGNDKWGLLAMVSYSKFDDLNMGSMHNAYNQRPAYADRINGNDTLLFNADPDKQLFSGYDQLNIVTKVSHRFSKSIDWSYNLYLSTTSDVPRYDRLIQSSEDGLTYAQWYYNPQRWLMNRLQIHFRAKTGIYDNAIYTLAYQNVSEGRNDRKFGNNWLRSRLEKVDVFSVSADYDKKLRARNFVYYGLDVSYNKVNSSGTSTNIVTDEVRKVSSRYPDGGTDYLQTGLYINYKKNFLKIPLTLLTGLRYSYISLRSEFKDTSFYQLPYRNISLNNNALTANAGLVFRPGSWQINLNISSGFRAPNLDDVAKIFDSEPGNVVVPNENLKPEYLYNSDLGFIYKMNNKAMIEVTGFYSYLVDAMVRRDFQLNGQDSILYDGQMSKVQALVNTGSATIYGLSAMVSLQIYKGLGFKSNLSYIKSKDNDGFSLQHTPPIYGSSSLTYDKDRLKIKVSAIYNAEVSYGELSPSERSKTYQYATDAAGNPYAPGWWTLNLNGSYAFNEKFLATFGIDNILDYRYRPFASGIAASGRNFILALRYSF